MQNILRMFNHHYYSPEFIIEDLQEQLEQSLVYLEMQKAGGNWTVVHFTEQHIGKLLMDIEAAQHTRN